MITVVVTTNSNFSLRVNRFPRLTKTDRGTENVHVAFIQQTIRHEGVDDLSGENSHRYGRSTANQVCNHRIYNTVLACMPTALLLQHVCRDVLL